MSGGHTLCRTKPKAHKLARARYGLTLGWLMDSQLEASALRPPFLPSLARYKPNADSSTLQPVSWRVASPSAADLSRLATRITAERSRKEWWLQRARGARGTLYKHMAA